MGGALSRVCFCLPFQASSSSLDHMHAMAVNNNHGNNSGGGGSGAGSDERPERRTSMDNASRLHPRADRRNSPSSTTDRSVVADHKGEGHKRTLIER